MAQPSAASGPAVPTGAPAAGNASGVALLKKKTMDYAVILSSKN